MLEVNMAAVDTVRLVERRLRAALRVQRLSGGGDSRQLPGSVQGPDMQVLCIAPGDWLVVSDAVTAAELCRRWSAEPAAAEFSLVDVTYDYAVFELGGGAAREILAKGCGLDLHPERFPPGDSTRTRLAKIAVHVACRESNRFELYVARSYAVYLSDWLRDAAVEFAPAPAKGAAYEQREGLLLESVDAGESKTQNPPARSAARPPPPRRLDPGG
jgi:heterotetrameric sarcosine oxidase gamma subunit